MRLSQTPLTKWSQFPLLLIIAGLQTPAVSAKTLDFGGHTWTVRADTGGPGPNTWSEDNAWLDTAGALHLKISYSNGLWQCAEVYTEDRMGLGEYQFQITGAIDQLDPNVVLGLFNYPTPDVGADSTNEIDIEFARWGNASYPNGNYTVYPTHNLLQSRSSTFQFALNGDQTTQRFTWTASSITFESLVGFTDGSADAFGSWVFTPRISGARISRSPMPVHINLWLFDGQGPSNGQPVEIVINAFRFVPGS
jgi:hypothetical protein